MLDVSGPRLDALGDHRNHFYSSHPPLSALLLAGAFSLFGVSEATFRGFLIAMSVVALLLFRRLAARLLPGPYDQVAAAAFALLPMFVFYSVVTCLHVVALVGILGAFLFYLRWRDSACPGDYAGIVGALLFACSSSWEGYYAAPVLAVAHLWDRRPRRAAALSLLGVNVAVFAVILLHLWAADPSGRAPIRSLLGAGLARSSLQGPALLPYLLGEAREVGLLLTVPATALAGLWTLTRFRAARGEGDGLIAASWLLGLHEIVFARLASGHEYYSYFLVVPVALGAGAGLRLVRELPDARIRAAAIAVLGAAFLGQSAWALSRRLGREGGYEFYWRLGLAVREAVAPEEKVFYLTDHAPFYTPFYADRASLWYDARNRLLLAENTGPRREGVPEEEVLRLLRENPGKLDWAVTADRETTVPRVAWLRGLDDRGLESYGVETGRTARRELLERLCGAPREVGGFLFWRLPRPP
jgi:4-amino-4-deoxy-L-arabinose transferase-like glycosyltransferase